MPAGTYRIDGHLVLKSNVELTGAGPATVIKAGPAFLATKGPDGGFPLITTAGAHNVTIGNLTADQSADTLKAADQPSRLSAYLIDVRDSVNVVVSGVHARDPLASIRSPWWAAVTSASAGAPPEWPRAGVTTSSTASTCLIPTSAR